MKNLDYVTPGFKIIQMPADILTVSDPFLSDVEWDLENSIELP